MRHTSIVRTFSEPSEVQILLSMRPALWKRIALLMYPLALLALVVGVLLDATDDGKQVWPWIVFGILCLTATWPGIQLLWNVFGEEFLEINTQAIRWRHNYGIVQTTPMVKNFETLRLSYKEDRVLEDISYGYILFFSLDENGFEEQIHETTIPIPKSEVLAFFEALEELFREQELMAFHSEVFLEN
jgi:hypothetical protein